MTVYFLQASDVQGPDLVAGHHPLNGTSYNDHFKAYPVGESNWIYIQTEADNVLRKVLYPAIRAEVMAEVEGRHEFQLNQAKEDLRKVLKDRNLWIDRVVDYPKLPLWKRLVCALYGQLPY